MPRCIDAERFSERFDMMCDAGGVLAPVTEAVREMVKKLIKAEPTVDVQVVRHGHWINGNCGDYVCSVCGWAFSDELPYMAREYDAETEEIMRYCMHCGARLELQGGAEMDIYEEENKNERTLSAEERSHKKG